MRVRSATREWFSLCLYRAALSQRFSSTALSVRRVSQLLVSITVFHRKHRQLNHYCQVEARILFDNTGHGFYSGIRGGTITGYALLSDIHGNTPALRAVLEDIDRENCRDLVVLGDTVAGFDQNGCMDLLEHRRIRGIKGNSEHCAQISSPDDLPDPENPRCLRLFRVFSWWRELISDENMTTIDSLPDMLVIDHACFIHDSPVDNPFLNSSIEMDPFYHSEGIYEEISEGDEEAIGRYLQEQKCKLLFCGHTHIPFIKRLDDFVICNVGSVGKPYDGRPDPAWAKWDGADEIEIRRVSYDVEEAIEGYRKINLDHPERSDRFAKALRNGAHWRGAHWRGAHWRGAHWRGRG